EPIPLGLFHLPFWPWAVLEILTYSVYAPVYSLRSPVGPDKALCPFNMQRMLSARLSVSKLATPITPTGIGSKCSARA
ncbi:hypothetical protein, partial [Dickeya ananatis]